MRCRGFIDSIVFAADVNVSVLEWEQSAEEQMTLQNCVDAVRVVREDARLRKKNIRQGQG